MSDSDHADAWLDNVNSYIAEKAAALPGNSGGDDQPEGRHVLENFQDEPETEGPRNPGSETAGKITLSAAATPKAPAPVKASSRSTGAERRAGFIAGVANIREW